MKRLLAMVLAFLCIISLYGCKKQEYELPWDHFCYYATEAGGVIELKIEEKRYIIDLLNNGEWYGELAKCTSDVKFATQKQIVGYCVEDGVFKDFTQGKSLKLSKEQKDTVNKFLGFNNK